MRINIVGTILGTSGYDSHTRQLTNHLYKLNPDIKLDVPLPQDWLRQVNDNELKMITCKDRTPDVTIMIATPPNWRIALGDNTKHFVGFLIWEGSSIPKFWIPYLLDERVNLIFVPSIHTRDAIENTEMSPTEFSIIKDKIKIVPHGVDLDIFKPVEVKRSNNFTFVCNKGWRGSEWDRGGVQYLLKAFCEEFRKDESVELLLKLNPAYINQGNVNQAIKNLNLTTEHADIKLICSDIPYNKLPELYCMGDVFVCTTRAEAFNLTGVEAMACGLPTIQTNYGGQLDYMNDGNSMVVNSVLEEQDKDILYEGIEWATPEISDIRKKMRYVFEHKEEMKVKGKIALDDSKELTWNNSAKLAIDFLNELK